MLIAARATAGDAAGEPEIGEPEIGERETGGPGSTSRSDRSGP
jgi:hypothetical protein